MRLPHLVWGAAVAVSAAQSGLAAEPSKPLSQYAFSTWNNENGLPQNSVYSIAQTRDGYLWFGTQEGLARFDGVRFVNYSRTTLPELPGNYIPAMSAARDGGLWVGTSKGLLYYHNGRVRVFTTREGLSADSISAILEAPDGALWVGTSGGGLNIVRDGRIRRIGEADGLPGMEITALTSGPNHEVWIGTGSGMARYQDGKLTTPVPELARLPVSAIAATRDGAVWIGTRRSGLFQYRNHRVTNVAERYPPLRRHRLGALLEDRSGSLWIAVEGMGVTRWRNGDLDWFTHREGLASGIPIALLEDHEGSVWVGCTYGVTQLRKGQFWNYGAPEGFPGESAVTVMETRRGEIWATADGGGVARLDRGRFRPLTVRDGLSSEAIVAMHEAADGAIWLGTDDGVLNRLLGGRITHHPVPHALGRPVQAILEDGARNLWVAIGGELSRYRNGRFDLHRDISPERNIHILLEARDGALWAGASGPLLVRSHQGQVQSWGPEQGLNGNAVYSMIEDAQGSFWIGVGTGGLVRLRDGRLTRFSLSEGLCDDSVVQVLDDGVGYLWLGSLRGLCQVNKHDLNDYCAGLRKTVRAVAFGRDEGMRNAECNGGYAPPAWRSRDGRLWFPTVKGITAVDPARLTRNTLPPAVRIERVIAGNRALDLSTGGATVAAAHAGTVEVHFTGISFLAPRKIRFHYRLEGFDRDWIDGGDRRAAYYTNLPPGNYRFRVRATNSDGAWDRAGAEIRLIVQPRFYQSLWFYAAAVLGLALVVWAWNYWRNLRILRRNQELETAVRARTEALRDAHLHLETVARCVPDVIWSMDMAGQFTYISPSVERMHGWTASEIEHVTRGHADDRSQSTRLGEILERELDQAAKPGYDRARLLTWEAKHVRDDGAAVWVEISTRLIWSDDGKPVGWSGVTRDITERKHAEDEREKLSAQLAQAQKMESVGRLAGGVAHDFNNLLTVINGYSHLALEATKRSDPLWPRLKEIYKAGERAAGITQQLLAYSRKQVLQMRVLDLNGVVGETQSMLRHLVGEDVEVRFIPGPETLLVRADRSQLEQVIMNLAVNARDAMPSGGRLVFNTGLIELDEAWAASHPGQDAGRYAVIEVSDTGVGMDQATQQKIFEPFFTTKDAGKGTGLGLSMVQGIVAQTGGHVSVYSEPGRGTTFRICLPVSTGTVADAEETVHLEDLLGNETVLVVEDRAELCDFAAEALKNYGYRVLQATDGPEAMKLATRKKNRFDLVLTDVVMPQMSGRELAERLTRLRPGIKTLFMSGYTHEVIALGMLEPDTQFIQKPFTPGELALKVRQLLGPPARETRGLPFGEEVED